MNNKDLENKGILKGLNQIDEKKYIIQYIIIIRDIHNKNMKNQDINKKYININKKNNCICKILNN